MRSSCVSSWCFWAWEKEWAADSSLSWSKSGCKESCQLRQGPSKRNRPCWVCSRWAYMEGSTCSSSFFGWCLWARKGTGQRVVFKILESPKFRKRWGGLNGSEHRRQCALPILPMVFLDPKREGFGILVSLALLFALSKLENWKLFEETWAAFASAARLNTSVSHCAHLATNPGRKTRTIHGTERRKTEEENRTRRTESRHEKQETRNKTDQETR